MNKRIQNRIAQSRRTLPVTAGYAVAVCLAAGLLTRQLWVQVLLLVVSALMMVELNNANSLIRIYSRTVSCSFLVLTTTAAFLLPSMGVGVTQLSYIVFFIFLFRAYQNQTASGQVFYAFIAIGVASMAFVQILFFVPVLWVLLATNVLAFSGRTFFASILGLLTPYWFVAAYRFYTGCLQALGDHFVGLLQLGMPFDLSILDEHRLVTAIFVLVLALVGGGHFLLYSYQDKIRTRMIYELFITLTACSFIFMILQPQHFDPLLGMAIVTTAPLIGHYLALAHSRLSNICFLVIVTLAVLITAYNLWMPSPIFS